MLTRRGTVIVLVDKPGNTWGVADAFKVDENRIAHMSEDLGHVRHFLADEMGPDFPLGALLEYGVGVHHAGLSDDTRTIVEWLTERNELRVLVATTTIAQGVNFPVSGVVFASHRYPYGQDMPPEDFWSIAGRAGRVDQGDLGIIALAAHDDAKLEKLDAYIDRSVGELASTLIDMVRKVEDEGSLLHLEKLAWRPEWSSFLQYLAHTYRQIGNHERFAAEAEQVLRGTLGFQTLRRSHPSEPGARGRCRPGRAGARHRLRRHLAPAAGVRRGPVGGAARRKALRRRAGSRSRHRGDHGVQA